MDRELEVLKKEIENIKNRNSKVEIDKAWETSLARKLTIALLTYTVIVIFFYAVKVEKPFVNSIVPTLGFLLSTLTISFLKKIWIKYFFDSK